MSGAEGATIIMLDDSETAIAMAKGALTDAGYRVISFTSAVVMIPALIRESPQLVLLDVNMPLLDGPTVLNQIRKHKHMRDTMVILYSDLPHAQLRILAEGSKADGYIRKGGDPKMLVFQIRRLLTKKPPHPGHPS